MTDSKTASTALAASFLDSSLFSATAFTKSVLFMTFTSSQKYIICNQQIITLISFVHQFIYFYTSIEFLLMVRLILYDFTRKFNTKIKIFCILIKFQQNFYLE